MSRIVLMLDEHRAWLELDENEREQLGVLLEAFGVFMEREQKYHSVWQQYGAVDSYHHITSKAARCELYLNGSGDENDAIDLINYGVFLIRNMRAGRVRGAQRDVVVEDSWRVVDQWWTGEPVTREYRRVKLPGSKTITQFRASEEEEWNIYTGQPLRASELATAELQTPLERIESLGFKLVFDQEVPPGEMRIMKGDECLGKVQLG